MKFEIQNKKYSEKQVYEEYIDKEKENYGGGKTGLKIAENSAKEFIKKLRKRR